VAVRAVLFDLDGTLVQTREASWNLFEETNRKFGLGVDSREQFFELFRDNFFRSLTRQCADPERLALSKAHFLENLRTRYTPPLVPGMADVVRALAARFTLVVLSTNTMETIRRILTGAGIAQCFAHVFAGDVEPDKAVSLRRFLADAGYRLGRRCAPGYDESGPAQFVPGDEALLVTDTVGDIKEAGAAGVRAVGVAWGMHTEDELRAAGAERVALWPQELCAWILPEADGVCTPSACTCPPPVVDPVRAAAEIRRARQRDRSPARASDLGHPDPPLAVARDAPLEAQLLATLKRLRM
jgi:phosphoglycolate phosphatase